MGSPTVVITSISSLLGALLNSVVMVLILKRGRKTYHYLFAAILLLCAVWDLGIFMTMIRNHHVDELPIYGYIIAVPSPFFTALFYHFTGSYLNQVRRRSTFALWTISFLSVVFVLVGPGRISGVYEYGWGNLFRPDERMLQGFLPSIPLYWLSIGVSVYLLSQAYKRESSPLRQRHMLYIMASFVAIGLAMIKILALFNVDNPFLLPFGMAMNDIAVAVIGIAILKDKLFDITVIIKKGTIYSALGALVIFLFSFTEHLLTTYFSELVSGHSTVMHFISIAFAIAILMPVKHRLEKWVERFFEGRQLKV